MKRMLLAAAVEIGKMMTIPTRDGYAAIQRECGMIRGLIRGVRRGGVGEAHGGDHHGDGGECGQLPRDGTIPLGGAGRIMQDIGDRATMQDLHGGEIADGARLLLAVQTMPLAPIRPPELLLPIHRLGEVP